MATMEDLLERTDAGMMDGVVDAGGRETRDKRGGEWVSGEVEGGEQGAGGTTMMRRQGTCVVREDGTVNCGLWSGMDSMSCMRRTGYCMSCM